MSSNSGAAQGGYSFHAEDLREIAEEWRAIGNEYDYALQTSDPMMRVKPMGWEPASGYYAAKANATGADYRRMLREARAYCLTQADKCEQALKAYLGREADHAILFDQNLNRLDGGNSRTPKAV